MSLSLPLEFLNPLMRDGSWPDIAMVLRWGIFLGMMLLLLRMGFISWRDGCRWPAAPGFLGFRMFFLLCGALLLMRQASWQLLGRQRAPFIAFMQRYDRREFNPAHRVRAGRIVDRNGVVLALSRSTKRGVRRFYPFGPLCSHVVGYNHPLYGLSGIEAAYRTFLLGHDPVSRAQWIELGKSLLDREAYAEGPVFQSSLDIRLQRLAMELLGARRGAVVVMDIDTGALRVMASAPAFDPNRLGPRTFQAGVRDAPLLNRALAGKYPPGSAWKPLVAAAALTEGFSGRLDTPPGGFTTSSANPPIRDHEYYAALRRGEAWAGRGSIGLEEALVHSSNTFFAQLGIEVGEPALERTMKASGLTRELYPSRDREASLRIPPAAGIDVKSDRPYDLAQFSIGQGKVLVSPMHVTMMMAGIANRGLCVQPRVELEGAVRPLGRICSPQDALVLSGMLREVVLRGTGRGIRTSVLSVAGKTGTAQTGPRTESHSWFAGFAPAENPRWAFCVLVENGGYGSAAAVPLANALFETGVRRGWLTP